MPQNLSRIAYNMRLANLTIELDHYLKQIAEGSKKEGTKFLLNCDNLKLIGKAHDVMEQLKKLERS